jgi:hypothetical protein
MNKLYGWIFTHTGGVWAATTRDYYNDLFNDFNSPHVLRSSNMTTLRDIIENKLDGDIAKLPAWKAKFK